MDAIHTSNRCKSYSKNGNASEISFAFDSDFKSFLYRHACACIKHPRPTICKFSGISIVVIKTSGTLDFLLLLFCVKRNGKIGISKWHRAKFDRILKSYQLTCKRHIFSSFH